VNATLPIVAPSILASDFANLQKEITMINESSADWIHVDIMDGVFVPNISMGLPVVHAVKKHARKPLDVHLMIVQPERYIESFRQAGADIISVHVEACTHLHRTIEQIKATGAQAGVALNPHTPVSFLSEIIKDIDLVCMMSVNPGFGGQKFIQNTYNKIRELRELMEKKNATKVNIEIDGGVNQENAKSLIDAGATVLVAGNFVFTSKDPKGTISKLKEL
jgi:ribulose-phosphate 3-epimerase